MDRFSDHFLDSCSIIGRILDFDKHHGCAVTYFNKKFNRHTSKRVEREINGRLNGLRVELLSFFQWISVKNFKGMPTDVNVMGFLNKYRYHDRDKNYRSLNRFFALYMDELKSYLLDKKDVTLDELRTCVINAISKAQNKLINMLHHSHPQQIQCHVTPNQYTSSSFHAVFANVSRVISYPKDALILLDSYYVKHHVVGSDIGFITTDYGDILSKTEDIQSELPGVYIFDMRATK